MKSGAENTADENRRPEFGLDCAASMKICWVSKLGFAFAGLAFVARAFMSPAFRDAEGMLKGSLCLPVAAGGALLVVAASVGKQWKRSALWFALALAGQAVGLQMIDAGRLIHYQHYKPLARLLTENHAALVLCLALQTALVAAGFKTYWPDIRAWLRRTFKPWQLLGMLLVFCLASTTVSREIPSYVAELAFATFVQVVNLVNIVLIVAALPESTLARLKLKLDQWFGAADDQESKIQDPKPVLSEVEGSKTYPVPFGNAQDKLRRGIENSTIDPIALLAAIWVIVLAGVLGAFSYQQHPHLADEVGYLYHGRYFAAGMLTMPAPPAPDAFKLDLMTYEAERWYSPVPPGWPAMLALGVFLGAPWLVNPLLAGINVLLSFVFLGELYDRRSARIGVLLLCVSPWNVFMAINVLTHCSTLTFALVAAVAVARARSTGKALWGWGGGMAAGMVSLIRPLDGAIVAGLLGLWAIGIGAPRLKASSIASLILGCIAIGAIVLPYNKFLTGRPTEAPLMAYFDKYYGVGRNALGFGPDRGVGWALDPFPGHGPIDAAINANLNVSAINAELFGWSAGSLVLFALVLFSGAMRRSDYLMLVAIAGVVAIYSLYWFSGGPDFGARYWYLALVPCVALTVSGIRFLEQSLRAAAPVAAGGEARVMIAVLAVCLSTIVNYFPWRGIDKYYHYLQMRPDIRYLAREYGFGRSLVLIRGNAHPDYASAAIYNPLDLRADAPIYAWDRNDKARAQALQAYPDRPVWLVEGPSLTRGAFRVVAGPFSGSALAAGGAR
jgi:hypothetical protein